jgi:peptidoglycan/xylan/chitin deacetylase (PgdA/CDA1 family)
MKLSIRNIIAYWYAKYIIWNGSIKKINEEGLSGKHILSIYFHNPTKDLFEKCINWLIEKGYVFISVEDLNQIRIGNKNFPNGSVILTVDDGWKYNIQNIVYPSNKLSIPVTIFITVEPLKSSKSYWWSYVKKAKDIKNLNINVEDLKKLENSERNKIVNRLRKKIHLEKESMSEDELIEITHQKSVSIGSHTITHPILTKCGYNRAENEIKNSKIHLEKIIKNPIKYFAYPNGDYGEREIKLLEKHGYEIAFSTRTEYLNKGELSNRYRYPRFEVMENVSFAENICRMTGVWFKNKSK